MVNKHPPSPEEEVARASTAAAAAAALALVIRGPELICREVPAAAADRVLVEPG
jgi:hypothetical protein